MNRPTVKEILLLMAISVASCGDDKCSPSDLDGSYLVTYTRESGMCAEISPVVTRYHKGSFVDQDDEEVNCTLLYPDFRYEACERDISYTCLMLSEGVVVDIKLHQEVETGGDRFDAIFTMEARTVTGVPGCRGIYRVAGVRQ
jgi:hypothetical protein